MHLLDTAKEYYVYRISAEAIIMHMVALTGNSAC